ncbi:tyrosine-type recombinase/integrase [Microbacterium thalli]|uniref:tyrosine-type recombinase/integrase n=1 Tax=Microbacterium thalli TaxID=3027921 RepID=UPI002366753C|nr:site-specific integrase [Microbacterium thalli]MDD7929694.1 site-specific integrase [Microbacterium thalli]
MTTKFKARFWDPAAAKYVHVGYFDTAEERDYEVAKAKLEHAKGLQPKVVEDRARGGELFVTFAERTLHHRLRTKKVTVGTWSNYNLMLQRWILPTFGQKKLRDITTREIDRWFNEVLPEGSPSNAQRYSVLSMIMKRAVMQGEIDRNPCLVEGVSAAKSKKRPTLSLGDFQVLVEAAATDQERALLWILMGSGCRIGEACALDWEQIDLRLGEMTVAYHLVGGERVEGTKAHPEQVRFLTLPQRAVEALRRHQETTTGTLDGPVFLNASGTRLRQDTAAKMFASIRASRGLDGFRLHDLRHASLTAYRRTATLAEVMSRGGHSDYRTALRYQHHSRTRDREIVSAMDLAFGAGASA